MDTTALIREFRDHLISNNPRIFKWVQGDSSGTGQPVRLEKRVPSQERHPGKLCLVIQLH